MKIFHFKYFIVIFNCEYFSKTDLSVLEMSPEVLGSLPTVGAGPDVLLGVDPPDVSVQRPLAGRGVAERK